LGTRHGPRRQADLRDRADQSAVRTKMTGVVAMR
jgi:hypothetical protein